MPKKRPVKTKRKPRKAAITVESQGPSVQPDSSIEMNFSVPQIAGWCLVLGGLWELLRWYPSGTFASAYVSAFALLLGTISLIWGISILGKQSREERDGRFILRLTFLVLMAFGFKNGWNQMGSAQIGAIVIAGLVWIYLNLPSTESAAEPDSQPKWAIPVIVGILALAAWLRFYHIMDVPFGLNTDEVFNSERYKGYLETGWHLFFTVDGHSMVAWHGTAFVMFHLLAKLGIHDVFALRLGSAIMGMLGLATFYLFIREILGWRAAIWGLAFMCVSSFSILVSRMDVCDPSGIALQSLVFYLFWKGLKGSRSWFVPCGFVLGLYMHGHYWQHFTVPALLLIFLLFSVATKKIPLKALPLILVILFISFGVVYLNMVNYYRVTLHTFLFDRVKQAQAANFDGFSSLYHVLSANFFKYIHFYISPEGGNAVIYNPDKPLLDPWTAGLLLLGVLGAVAAWTEKKMETIFLLFFFVLMLIPASAAEYAPTVHRISNQITVLFGLVGFAADRLQRLPGGRRAAWWSWISGLALLAVLGISTNWNYRTFFVDFRNNYACREYWGGILGQVAETLRDAPKGTELIVSDAYDKDYRSNMIAYEAAKDFRFSDTSLVSLFPITGTAGVGAVIVQEPSLELAAGIFNYLYPHAVLHVVPDLSNGASIRFREPSPQNAKDVYCYYEIPGADIDAARGLQFSCGGSDKTKGGAGLSLPAGSSAEGCKQLSWEGSLWVPRSQNYSLRGSLPWGLQLSLSGKPLKADQSVFLGKGLYPFKASASGSEAVPAPGQLQFLGQDGLKVELGNANSFRVAKFSKGLRTRYFRMKPGQSTLLDLSKAHSPAVINRLLSSGEDLAMSRIEPTIFGRYTVLNYGRGMEFPAPYDLVWDGHIVIPETDSYLFFDESKGSVDIWVDGKRCDPSVPVHLTAGDHALFAYHRLSRDGNQSIAPVTLMVSRSGKDAELLPMEWLRPD